MTPTPDSAAPQGEVAIDPAYMEWPALNAMLHARFSDDDRDDNDLCVTRAEACALLSWARLFDRQAQPRRDEEEQTYDIIRRAADLIETVPPAQQAGVEDALREAAQTVVSNAQRSYRSRGKDRYIEDESGELMMLVPFEDWYRLEHILEARAALRPSTDAAAPSQDIASSTSGLTDGGDTRYLDGYAEGQRIALLEREWMEDKAWQDAVLSLVHYRTVAMRTWLVGHEEDQRRLDEWWRRATALAYTKSAADIAALAQPDAVTSGMADRGDG